VILFSRWLLPAQRKEANAVPKQNRSANDIVKKTLPITYDDEVNS
jgi:hypothetical protein